MISWLEGTVIQINPRFLVLNVSGTGYKVWTSGSLAQNTAKMLGKKLAVWTHFVVREDAHDLYGFVTTDELEFFELLLTISGIGPKTAAGIMSVAPLATLRVAVVTEDAGLLTNIPGIGKKNAEKIVRELQNKLVATDSDIVPESTRTESDVLEALKALGYTERDAREVIKKIPKDIEDTSSRIKHALKSLANK